MKYDILGNLVKDDSRGLDTITYDYRNLMSYSFFTSINVDSLHDIYRFTYDESGMRIKKVLNYWYYDSQEPPCDEVQDSTMGDWGFIWGGGMMMGGDPPGEDPEDPPDPVYCPVAHHSETLYLYDGGVLLATFDEADSVRDLFVNGPAGRLATYFENDDDKLYFYLKDHLGNARMLVHRSEQTQYYVYYPFGEIVEAGISSGTEFQFTGKERDAYSGFEFDYFGARYYDSRTGSFTTLDNAAQYANGFGYCGNNPISMIDSDGNWAQVVGTVPKLWEAGLMLGGMIFGMHQLSKQPTLWEQGQEGGLGMGAFLSLPVSNLFGGSNFAAIMAGNVGTSVGGQLIFNWIDRAPAERGLGMAIGNGIVNGLIDWQYKRSRVPLGPGDDSSPSPLGDWEPPPEPSHAFASKPSGEPSGMDWLDFDPFETAEAIFTGIADVVEDFSDFDPPFIPVAVGHVITFIPYPDLDGGVSPIPRTIDGAPDLTWGFYARNVSDHPGYRLGTAFGIVATEATVTMGMAYFGGAPADLAAVSIGNGRIGVQWRSLLPGERNWGIRLDGLHHSKPYHFVGHSYVPGVRNSTVVHWEWLLGQ